MKIQEQHAAPKSSFFQIIAFILTRSTTPWRDDSIPTGICITNGLAPSLSLIISTHLKKSAPVLSSLFTKQILGTLYLSADKYKVPRICFVNKLDRTGADFFRCVEMIKDRLGAKPLVMQIPVGIESSLQGVVDLVKMKAIIWKNEDLGAACCS